MTTPAHEPLWDWYRIEDAINAQWNAHGGTYQYIWVRELLREVADEYESVLTFDRTRYAEQQAIIDDYREWLDNCLLRTAEDALRIEELGQQLQRARKWLPDSVLEGSDDDD